ncbi:LysR family transcriptional regulator [Brevundimonas guildfordensis]|uniref:LysR family transcriptional regulator n=1 Tax=Brevundimonas guildfordensis TaxID=2762241 RepID=A0ABR8QYZ2_9CAUL|nr:LysR family transcriptional regulator [Brevundimonas guildfordensis]MBD7940745.1 LysR family transcriptional regulator [Brevundimonas guildfordensis]
MFDWDDLRVFLAAARAGSLATAAQRLGVDAATVGRRVARLETALKSTLLVRSAAGLQLTATGAQLLERALDAESAMEAAGRVTQPDLIAGAVRISASEGFGGAVLAPALPGLLAAHPGLNVELAASSGFLSPSRREVDMAITLSPADSPRLIVEPLTTYQLALYASAEHMQRHGVPESIDDLNRFDMVGYVDDLIYAPELRYLEEIRPNLRPRLASSSIRAQRDMVAAGGGIGVLPCFMAEGLTRVLADQVQIERRFWLSTHREVHGSARLKTVRRWIKALCRDEAPRLTPLPSLSEEEFNLSAR